MSNRKSDLIILLLPRNGARMSFAEKALLPRALLSACAWQIQCPTQRSILLFLFPDKKQKKVENVFRGKYQAGANSIKGQVLHLNGKPG
jgi:hypothetical protein